MTTARSIFTWLVVTCAAPSLFAQYNDAEKDAVLAIRKWATNVQPNKEGSVRLVRLSRPHVTDAAMEHLRSFPNLEYLAVVHPAVTDAGFANMAGCSKLETLLLSGSGLTDAGTEHFSKLENLQRLYVDDTAISDSGLAAIAQHTGLKVLSLQRTKITDAGLAHLGKLADLEALILSGTAITDAGLKHLKGLSGLKTLYLANTSVTGTELQVLAELPRLEYLSLSGTRISADSLRALGGASNLKQVLVFGCDLPTGAGDPLRDRMGTVLVAGVPDAPAVQQAQSASLPPVHKGGPRLSVAPARDRFRSNAADAPDFQRHVIPLLGRLGCNGRNCHGAFQGQGGFRLSMFGYDFAADHDAIAGGDEPRVRRDNPAESLILNKPTSADEHEGGLRFEKGGWEYNLLHRWIEDGANGAAKDAARFERLRVSPSEVVFERNGQKVALKVEALWSDGSVEDVTCLTRFQSNDDVVAVVDEHGVITSEGAGDTHVIVFYDNGVVAVPVLRPVADAPAAYPQLLTNGPVDELVNTKLRKLGIVPSDLCTDEEFLRRASLDLIGTLPAPREILEFVADESDDKRNRKIDELLERPAYTMWWTNRLCDLTGSNAGYLGNTDMAQPVAAQWRAWIERRVRDNVGWDRIVAGIIVASSRRPGQTYEDFVVEQSAFEERNGAADFAAIGNPMPHYWYRDNQVLASDKALTFGFTFLGVRLQCAQCHKHPYDQWSKQDFDEFTQFFTRIRRGIQPDATESHRRLREMLAVPDILNTAALRRQSYMRIAVEGNPIPWNEIYIAPPGTKPQIGRTLGGQPVNLNDYSDPRELLMAWLLEEDNPYFARAFVNRIWANYFNVGIVDPPDDMNLANPPSNAALLDWLAQQFVEHGYDMKWLHREILRSRTYQLSWRPNATNETDERNFSRAIIRRLPAEVAIDAILQSTAGDRVMAKVATDVKNRKIGQHPRSYQTRSIDYSLLIFGKPLRTTNCDCERRNSPTLLQSLYVRNDDEVLKRLTQSDGWVAQSRRVPKGVEPTDRDRVEELVRTAYLRTLSRRPEPEELADCTGHILEAENVPEGLRDVMWSLLNTQEFITNH